MKKADFLSLLTAFAASSFHEGASLQGHKGPTPRGGVASRSDDWGVCLRKNKTSGTAAPEVCGRGSKSRTHGTRFWRPLLYQLSYTPIYLSHSLNA